MAVIGGIVSNDGVGLACTSLSICEDGGIDTLEKLFDGVLDEIKDVFLGGFRRQDVIKLHIGVVPWPSNL